ncbi:MAG TPA: CPBP family intramembrane glutamic endopeptidase [Chlamydiales bacterium]|nr:CPBP family intramembrane glutamic endopeptidase [Chlamydiales bacterium]
MSSETYAIVALGILAYLLLWTGKRRGFFVFSVKPWEVPLRFVHLIGAFAIYFLVTFCGTTIVVSFLKNQIANNYVGFSTWFNFLMSFLIFSLLAFYLSKLPERVRKGLLRRPSERGEPLLPDVWAAFYAWILAFPLVLFLSQALELLVTNVFQITQLPDQVAVQFLKSTFASPLYFLLATVSIIILAPLVEETLFRGFLQTFIRQHLGSKQAILITSVCFSLFHYASGQTLGNISIIISLFVLSLFLGFLYEKRGSILAPMTLHASFNAISVINLYIFGGFTPIT